MSSEHSSPPPATSKAVPADTKDVKLPIKGIKRKHSAVATSITEADPATAESSANKRRERGIAIANGLAEKRAKLAEKRANLALRAAEKAQKDKEKAEKRALRDVERKKRREDRAAAKAKREELKKEADEHKKKRKLSAAEKQAAEEAREQVKAEKKRRKLAFEKYCQDHEKHGSNAILGKEPRNAITQSDAGHLYMLKPNHLACLKHFPKPNPHDRSRTMKLFDEDSVKILAFEKYALLAGITEGTKEEILAEGERLWREQ